MRKYIVRIFVLVVVSINLSASEKSLSWQDQQFKIILSQIKKGIPKQVSSFTQKPIEEIELLSDSASHNEKFIYFYDKMLFYLKSNIDHEYKKQYDEFLISYRKTLETKYYKSHQLSLTESRINTLQLIAFRMFSSIELNEFKKNLTNRVASLGGFIFDSETIPQSVLDRLYHLRQKVIHTGEYLQAIRKGKNQMHIPISTRLYETYQGGVTWSKLDLYLMGSPISKKYVLEKKSSHEAPVTFVRMSTPTIGSNENAYINPEFYCYLISLKKKKLKHTYLNLQDNRQ